MEKQSYTFEDFCSIVDTLRSPEGCPWDREQTHESLKPCLLEESYEVLDGIDTLERKDSWDSLCEELGDLLLQVVMHSCIAEEEGYFTLENVIDGISRKMIRRHPHVFGTDKKKLAEEVPGSWEELKKMEKKDRTMQEELQEIPEIFPALVRAQKVQKKEERFFGEKQDRSERLQELMDKLSEYENTPVSAEEGGDFLWKTSDFLRKEGVYAELALKDRTTKEIRECGSDNSAKEG